MSASVFRRCVAAVTVALSVWGANVPDAHAQQYLIGASAEGSSGIEGGGANGGMRLTRTRLRLGGDLRIDESPDDIFEFAAIAEVGARSGFGADARYARAAGSHFLVEAGLMGIVAPESLYGACAAFTFRLPLLKGMQLLLGPEADFFFLGSDLPDGTVLWQARFQGGLRVDL